MGTHGKLTRHFMLAAVLAFQAAGAFAENTVLPPEIPPLSGSVQNELPQHESIFHAMFISLARTAARMEGPKGALKKFDATLVKIKDKPYSKSQLMKDKRKARGLLRPEIIALIERTVTPYVQKSGHLDADDALQVALTLGHECRGTLDRKDKETQEMLQTSAAILARHHVQDQDGTHAADLVRLAIVAIKEITSPAASPKVSSPPPKRPLI